jgi:hypothetical protein
MQLLIHANKNQGVSQCGFAHVGHLPRSPDEFEERWKFCLR